MADVPRMLLVPLVATDEMHEAVAETFHATWSAAYKQSMALHGKPAFASFTFTSAIWPGMVAAAPHSGRVPRVAAEAFAMDVYYLVQHGLMEDLGKAFAEHLGLEIEEAGDGPA